MKRIDKRTQRKLYWLFIPMALVVVWMMLYLWFGVNLLDRWFGWDVDVLTWCKPALLGGLCELTVSLIMLLFMLLNMSDFFVDLLLPDR